MKLRMPPDLSIASTVVQMSSLAFTLCYSMRYCGVGVEFATAYVVAWALLSAIVTEIIERKRHDKDGD